MIDEQNQQTTPSETPNNISETSNSGESLSPNAVQEIVDEPQDNQSAENQNTSSQETDPILDNQGNTENEAIISTLQQENANLKKLLDEKIEQSNGVKAQYARLAADFDNFRKRTIKEKENLEKQTKKAIITQLLPVVDNFERARVQIQPATDGEQTIQNSYQGVYKTLVDCLKKLGVSAMRPEGQEFDPNFHEAMLREATDEYPEDTVIEQLMRGYMLEEQVIRHAMVKVAVPKEPVITSEEEETSSEDGVADED